jgi:SAM-dependent methyltransferase
VKSINQTRWNDLYRCADQDGRPPGEVDSVPSVEEWGDPELALSFPGQWAPGASSQILDAGCGNGSVLASLVRTYAFHAVGFDIADQAVCIAHDRIRKAGLSDSIEVFQQSFHEEWRIERTFDFVLSLYAMQFALHSQIAPMMKQVARVLKPGGRFCCKMRSVSRSVPSTYITVPGERNTYLSQEPHESGMIYHHYDAEDVDLMVQMLGGRLEHSEEVHEYRDYDAFPSRAWWEIVIRR